MSPEQFLHKLRERVSCIDGISLSVRDDGPCPRFKIKSAVNEAASIKGHYCESGDSFIQVASSGREQFTGDETSAMEFLELIEDIVNILRHRGCVETQWSTPSGEVRRSVVDLQLPRTGSIYRLGKAPHFWHRGLAEHTQQFAPFQMTGISC